MMRALGRGTFAMVSLFVAACGGGEERSNTNGSATPQAETSGAEGGPESYALDDFVAQMVPVAADQVCSDGSFFQRCSTMTAEQCRRGLAAAVGACVDELRPQLPARVDASNGEATGNMIGECIGVAMGTALAQNGMLIDSPECRPQS